MNPLEGILQLLQQQAGPRGYTFAGRHGRPGESLVDLLGRFPQGEAESGGVAMQSPELLRTLLLIGAFGPIRSPQQKQIIRALWRRDPALVRELSQSPSHLDVGVGGPNIGQLVIGEGAPSLEIGAGTMRGGFHSSDPFRRPHLPRVAIHEGQHLLTRDYMESLGAALAEPGTIQRLRGWTERAKPALSLWQGRPEAVQYIENSRAAIGPIRAFEETVSIVREALTDPKLPMTSRNTLVQLFQELFGPK